MEWDLHLPAHGFQDPLDQGNIPEDLLCQVNPPSSLDYHVARRRCKVNPQWTLCVDRQVITAPTSTTHLIHPGSQLWIFYDHNRSVFQGQGRMDFAKRNRLIR